MISRSIRTEAWGFCCGTDGEVRKKFPRPLIYEITETSIEYPEMSRITLEEWKDEILEIVLTDASNIFGADCNEQSSLFGCGTKLTDTTFNETMIFDEVEITLSDLEELIYDIYLKKYRVRIVPTNVTDAVSYMYEHGIIRSEKIPARGIDIERYCIGSYWCFDTIGHTNEFKHKYPKVTGILEQLKIG